ncbi:MAG: large conductance mechanosensitive channel protein MscL [bacterium]
MLKEFREFAMKGNVLDMAVGIIIGGVFTPIVKALVDELLMPLIGLVIGKVDFSGLYLLLKPGAANPGPYETLAAAKAAGAVVLGYGAFVNTIVTFLIVSFALFLLVKGMNKLKREEAAAPKAPSTKPCPKCCTDIPIKAVRCPACTSELAA